jgi:1-phosphofructokinase family hexose kinase
MKVLTVTLHPAVDRILKLEQFQPSDPMHGVVLHEYPAGKGINAARALHRLGVPVLATGFLGKQSFDALNTAIRNEGMDASFLPCAAPTRTTTIIQETHTGKQYIITESRQAVTEQEVRLLLRHIGNLMDGMDLCLLCGAGEGPFLHDAYAQFVALATQKGVRCLLDSSGLSLKEGLTAKPLGVKVNREELSMLADSPLNSQDQQAGFLRKIVESGIGFAAMSDQARGMLADNGIETWAGSLNVDPVINTIGCGDAMLAGMAKAVLEKLPLQEMVRWGVACGTANTQQPGAGFIEMPTVRSFLSRVVVNPIPRKQQ